MHEFPNDASETSPIEYLLQDYLDCTKENDKNGLSFEDNFAAEILDSSYEAGDIQAMADSCSHLTPEQQEDLFKLLSKFDIFFNNKLKMFTDEKIYLEVNPSVTPHHSCAYSVPHSHKATFKKELEQLVQEGVKEKCGCATWVAGTFIILKKDGQVCWVSDF